MKHTITIDDATCVDILAMAQERINALNTLIENTQDVTISNALSNYLDRIITLKTKITKAMYYE